MAIITSFVGQFLIFFFALGRFHAVQVGIKRKTKDNVSFLMELMDVLEKVGSFIFLVSQLSHKYNNNQLYL